MDILVDSLHSKLTGIASINEALVKNGYSEDFNTIFKNWLIAMVLMIAKWVINIVLRTLI